MCVGTILFYSLSLSLRFIFSNRLCFTYQLVTSVAIVFLLTNLGMQDLLIVYNVFVMVDDHVLNLQIEPVL